MDVNGVAAGHTTLRPYGPGLQVHITLHTKVAEAIGENHAKNKMIVTV